MSRRLAPALLALLALGLCLAVEGAPAGMVLLGVIALRVAGGRLLGLGSAGAWAAAVVLTTGILLAGLLVGGVVLPRALGPWPALLVLIAPLALAALSYAMPPRPRAADLQPWLDPTVAGITSGVLAVAAWIGQRAPGARLSWAMSGDARNHVLLMRDVLTAGGVTREQLLAYPITSDGIAAAIAAPGRAGLAPGQLLTHDIGALVSTYVLMLIAVCVLFAAGVAAMDARGRPAGSLLMWAAVVASGLPITALVTGTALQDGFFSAYLGLVILVAALVLAISLDREPGSRGGLLVLAAAAPLLLTVWSVLAVIVVPAVVLLALWGVGSKIERITSVLLALAVPAVLLAKHTELGAVFVQPGGVTRPHEGLLTALVLFCAVGAIAATVPERRRQCLLLLSGLGAGVVVLCALAVVGPGPARWQYYGSKTLWLVTAAFLWLLVAPAADLASRSRNRGVVASTTSSLAVVALAAVAYPLADMSTVLPSPLERAKAGWSQPNAVSVPALELYGDQGHPFVFWHWTDGATYTGEDRIDTFWSIAAWAAPTAPYSIDPVRWGYESTGDPQQLCALADAVPGLRVITRDPLLVGLLQRECTGATPTTLLDG